MRTVRASFFLLLAAIVAFIAPASAQNISGFRDPAAERALDQKFNAVPDAKLAEDHLRTLTAKPHLAGTPEDKETADYVARKFRDAGLETQIVEYKVWLGYPKEISVDRARPLRRRDRLRDFADELLQRGHRRSSELRSGNANVHVEIRHRAGKRFLILLGPLGRADQPMLLRVPTPEHDGAFRLPSRLQ